MRMPDGDLCTILSQLDTRGQFAHVRGGRRERFRAHTFGTVILTVSYLELTWFDVLLVCRKLPRKLCAEGEGRVYKRFISCRMILNKSGTYVRRATAIYTMESYMIILVAIHRSKQLKCVPCAAMPYQPLRFCIHKIRIQVVAFQL